MSITTIINGVPYTLINVRAGTLPFNLGTDEGILKLPDVKFTMAAGLACGYSQWVADSEIERVPCACNIRSGDVPYFEGYAKGHTQVTWEMMNLSYINATINPELVLPFNACGKSINQVNAEHVSKITLPESAITQMVGDVRYIAYEYTNYDVEENVQRCVLAADPDTCKIYWIPDTRIPFLDEQDEAAIHIDWNLGWTNNKFIGYAVDGEILHCIPYMREA